jgi:hypothetical protein
MASETYPGDMVKTLLAHVNVVLDKKAPRTDSAKAPKAPEKKRGERGVVILEAALILPVFILVSFVLIDIQWMTRNAQALEYIVTEAAHCEAIQGSACTAPNSPTSFAEQLGQNVRITLRDDQISAPLCNGSTCQVTVTYRYKPLGAWFPDITITRTGMAAQAPNLP